MKKVLLFFALVFVCQLVHAQCDKKVTFKCRNARNLKDGVAGENVPLEATISFEGDKISFVGSMNGESETVECTLKELLLCEWTEFLQNGKAKYQVVANKNNVPQNTIIEINSDGGTTRITLGSDPDNGSKLQLDVYEYTVAEEETPAPAEPETPAKKEKKKSKDSFVQ